MAVDKRFLDSYFARFPQVRFGPGERLMSPDENPKNIFYLESGRVREYLLTDDGEEAVVNIFKAGAFFPMSYPIARVPNKYFFETETKGSLRMVPLSAANALVRGNPEVAYDLLRRLYVGMDGLLDRLSAQLTGSARDKILVEMIISGKRFGADGFKISESAIASRTGLSRETVSREVSQLKKKGLAALLGSNRKTLAIKFLQTELKEKF